METLPQKVEDYSNKTYWETRFGSEDEYDWLCSYDKYNKILEKLVRPKHKILVIGCGNSNLSASMYKSGFKKITNIDYSDNVISHMKNKHTDCPEMSWLTMDILEMSFDHEAFDIVIDKATLDTFMVCEKDPWNISIETQGIMGRILKQVSSTLKVGGRFISITWAQPHFRKRLLAKAEYQWSIQTEAFGEGFEYFVYIMTKGETLSEGDWALSEYASKSKETCTTLAEDDNEDFLNLVQI